MNTAIDKSAFREKQPRLENLRNELRQLYWDLVGKEPDPKVVWAEAEDLVAQYGPNFELKDLFCTFSAPKKKGTT